MPRLILPILLIASTALGQPVQDGPKLVGTGAVGESQQGAAVALSADGATAIIGGPTDTGGRNTSLVPYGRGAAWVWTRTTIGWSQQGSKLTASDAVGSDSQQGWAVGISGDGSTAIVGAPLDNNSLGAAWIWNRTGASWTQGSKLLPADSTGRASFGIVALSADGNTAVIGGPTDDLGIGATWIFTRSGNSWTQQGPKLIGSGAIVKAAQGAAVAISADGNTIIVGGTPGSPGAAWIFTRANGVWSQQGPKLVGPAAISSQGIAVALSADGNTALIGAHGGAWIWTRSGSTWTMESSLIATGGTASDQGRSVSLSADGNTAIVGAPDDNLGTGAAFLWERHGTSWTQVSKITGTGAQGIAVQGNAVALSADARTALIGARGDNNLVGAAWVFVVNGSAVPALSTFSLLALLIFLGVVGALRLRL